MDNGALHRVLTSFNIELNKVVLPEDAFSIDVPPADELQIELDKGTPFLGICPPKINSKVFFEVFDQVGCIVKSINPGTASEVDRITASMPFTTAERELFVSLAMIPGAQPLAGLATDISQELFGMVLGNTVRIFMIAFHKAVEDLYDDEKWLRGICPVCGSKPALAQIEQDTNKRYLLCATCSSKWRFQRVGCPYCRDADFGFLVVEGKEHYRVYHCDHCHGYLKTIYGTINGNGEIDVFQENLDTLPLDIMAMREGYSNT